METFQGRELAPGMRDHLPSYIICSCGAWCSVGYDYYRKSHGDRCYMCHRALFADMPVSEIKTTFVVRRHPERSQVLCVGWLVPDQNRHPGKKIADGCGRRIAVRDLVYIQTMWYTEPHGCTGGDYWNYGEGQFVCPHCGVLNRLATRHDAVDLKPYFKKIVEKPDKQPLAEIMDQL